MEMPLFIKMQFLKITLLIAGLISFGFYFDEGDPEKFKRLLFSYIQERPTTHLYLHIDKNVYAPGETLWFKAYLPSTSNYNSEGLFIRITDNNNAIVVEKQFTTYDIRAHGNITLPDTLTTGEYQLYAYTDKMMNFDPQHTFLQPIKVTADPANRLLVKAEVTDTTLLAPGKSVEILCKLSMGNKAVEKAAGIYTVTTQDKVTIAHGNFSTGKTGEARFSFKYPEISPYQNMRLAIKLNKDSNETDLALNLPAQSQELNLKTYVEGGRLVEGVKSKLLLETFDQFGRPLVTGILLKDNKGTVASAKTNRLGQATIWLTPKQGTQYTYTIHHKTQSRTVPFDLKYAQKGWAMRVEKKEKGFAAMVYNRGMPETGTLLINTPDQVLWQQQIKVRNGDSLLVPLRDVDSVKQVLNLALFSDSGKLECERLFLTRQQENYKVTFQLNKTSFGRREKVSVNFKISDARGKPIQANLSVAAVYEKALQEAEYKTILNTAYHLLSKPDKTHVTYNDKDKEFNDGLIAMNWWRHSWNDIIAYQPSGRVRMLANAAGVTGQIKSKRNKPVKINNLIVLSAGMTPLQIDEKGYFSIPPANLLAEEGKKNYIIANPDFFEQHVIKVNAPEKQYDERIVMTGLLKRPINFITATPPPPPPLPSGRINLKEVQIVADYTPRMSYEQMRAAYPDDCRDYVCSYGVVNCPQHTAGGVAPVLGQSYKYTSPKTKLPVMNFIYTHCINAGPAKEKNFQIKRIDKPREFKLPNYKEDFMSEENFQSTLYWNPNIFTDKNGEGSFEFYTADLKGIHKILLQGIEVHSSRPVFGTAEIVVK